ncbi:hypothetical protein [Streptomyces sp. NPDC054794]
MAEHDGLTSVQLPTYTRDLNPVEGIWSLRTSQSTSSAAKAASATLSWTAAATVRLTVTPIHPIAA